MSVEFVDAIDVGLDNSSHNVGVGSEAIVDMVVVLYLHVHLTGVVGALADALQSELLEGHGAMDDVLEGVDGSIYRTIASSSRFKMFIGNQQADTGYRTNAHACCYLEIFQFYIMGVGSMSTCKDKNIIIGHFFLLVCQSEECFINRI